MTYKNLRLEVADQTATLTLNRPERLNALDNETLAELAAVFSDLYERDDFRLLLLTGEGRAFCAGGDVKGQPTRFTWNRDRHRDRLRAIHFLVVRALAAMEKPTVALVNGVAAGGGLSLVLACDIRLASSSARFGAGFRRVALSVDMGLSYFLPRAVGRAKAMEILYTGELMDAKEALRIGLVNRVVPDESLHEEGRKLARTITSGPSLALECAKKAVRKGSVSDLDTALELEADLQSLCLNSSDHQEGVKAFLEKRDPKFSGR